MLAEAVVRTWLPVALPAALASRRARRVLLASIAVPSLLEWLQGRPPLGPGTYAALRTLDNAAYCAGVWRGCAAQGTLRPLLPRFTD